MSYQDFRAGFISIINMKKPGTRITGEIELVIRQEYDRLVLVASLEASLGSIKVPVFKTDNRGAYAAKSLIDKGRI